MPFTHLSAPLSARENNSTVILACSPWPGKDNFQERNEQSFPRSGDRAEIQTNTNTQVTKGRAAQGGKLVSGAGTPTSPVKLKFLSTGNKDSLCFSGKYHFREGRTSGPSWEFRITDI